MRIMRRGGRAAGAGAALFLAAAVLAASGCAGPIPAGSAAIVGEDRVTTDALAGQVAEIQRGLGQPVDTPDEGLLRSVLQRMIVVELVEVAAERQGIDVPQGEVDAAILTAEAQLGSREAIDESLLQSNVPPSELERWIRFNLLIEALARSLVPEAPPEQQQAALFEYVVATGEEIGVTVSPRFGTWNPADLQIGPTPTDLSIVPSSPVLDPLIPGE